MKTDWNLRFMRMADLEIAQWSKDHSSKVGAIIIKDREIVTTEFNGIPRGINDDIEARHEKPEKHYWFIHAESNAIINAARQGKSTLGCDLYVNWFPCHTCAGFIVQAGIKRIFCDKEPDLNNLHYGESFKRALKILEEGDVEIIYMNYVTHRQSNISNNG